MLTSSPIKKSVWIETERCFLSVVVNKMKWQAFWTKLKGFFKQEQLPLSGTTKPNYSKKNIENPKQGRTCCSVQFQADVLRLSELEECIRLMEESTLIVKGTVYILDDIKILHYCIVHVSPYRTAITNRRLSSFRLTILSQRE